MAELPIFCSFKQNFNSWSYYVLLTVDDTTIYQTCSLPNLDISQKMSEHVNLFTMSTSVNFDF